MQKRNKSGKPFIWHWHYNVFFSPQDRASVHVGTTPYKKTEFEFGSVGFGVRVGSKEVPKLPFSFSWTLYPSFVTTDARGGGKQISDEIARHWPEWFWNDLFFFKADERDTIGSLDGRRKFGCLPKEPSRQRLFKDTSARKSGSLYMHLKKTQKAKSRKWWWCLLLTFQYWLETCAAIFR